MATRPATEVIARRHLSVGVGAHATECRPRETLGVLQPRVANYFARFGEALQRGWTPRRRIARGAPAMLDDDRATEARERPGDSRAR